ncbi:rhodanese [Bacillus coahuilensis m2-6]|uniref:rhodanese-like domain-containing protein n=1 Tax=Bacillus coahuilensis TaxID=408580 RepID=UPI0007501116|nr:rhodanese-like domain-containing protein [Bacillus coahuilensis]KUP05672.1 rhodanese [Bacillus coahuilensis m2-6]
MDWLDILIPLALLLFFGRMLLPVRGITLITTEQLKEKIKDQHVQLIDVRTNGEFKGRNISSFKNLPLHQLGSKLDTLDPSKEVVLICQSGMRSSKAAKLLKKKGFKKITNVSGGMNAWRG